MEGAAEHPLRPVALASAAWHVLWHDGDRASALQIASGAVDASSPEPSVARCRGLSALAGIAAEAGDIEGALPIGRQWLTEAESLGDRWETLEALTTVGIQAGAIGDEAAARIPAERAVVLADEIGSPSLRAFSRLALGLALAPPTDSRRELSSRRRAALAVEARND